MNLEDKQGYADRIERARKHKKMPRRHLGERMDPPVSYETVRSWETGKHIPELFRLYQIRDLTGVRLAWLLADSGPMLPTEAPVISGDVLAASLRALSPEERAKVLADAFEGA